MLLFVLISCRPEGGRTACQPRLPLPLSLHHQPPRMSRRDPRPCKGQCSRPAGRGGRGARSQATISLSPLILSTHLPHRSFSARWAARAPPGRRAPFPRTLMAVGREEAGLESTSSEAEPQLYHPCRKNLDLSLPGSSHGRLAIHGREGRNGAANK